MSKMSHYIREYGSTALIVLVGGFLIYRLVIGGPHPLDGQAAPAFSLPDTTGKTMDLASHLGKDVVVLDFWASWCPPCREGLPIVDQVAGKFSGEPVAVYAVNIREGVDVVKAFAKQFDLSLPILLDDKGAVADSYGVTGIPQTVIIDRNGMVHAVHVGVTPLGLERALVSDIKAALAVAVPKAA